MAEAELHVLRMRLNGAIRNKMTRGTPSRSASGTGWGESEGQGTSIPIAVTGAIRTVFEKFAELASSPGVALVSVAGSVVSISVPIERFSGSSPPTSPFMVLSARLCGAYAYGVPLRRYVDETDGSVSERASPQDQWVVLIPNHPGFIDWVTLKGIKRLASFHPAPAAVNGPRGLRVAARTGHLRAVWSSPVGYYKGRTPRLVTTAATAERSMAGEFGACVGRTSHRPRGGGDFSRGDLSCWPEAALAAQDLGEAQDQAALKQFRLCRANSL